jgi:hypothetical protein
MKVAVIMEHFHMPVMPEAIDILKSFEIEVEVDIISAHRTPEKLFDFSKNNSSTRNFGGNCWSWRRSAFTRNGCINVNFSNWCSSKIK